MLRLTKHLLIAAGAAALAASAASLAQGGGTLSERLDAAETKLQTDTQTCQPINLGEYTALLAEAAKNVKRAAKATKAGAPVNAMQVDADFTRASKLFNSAQAALVQQCVRSIQAQGAPPPPAATPAQPASQSMNLSPFARGILAVHNSTRAEFGAPPLKWDAELAGRAGAWAGELATIGRLEHSPREGRGTERENIGQGPLGYSAVQIVNLWVDERVDFVPGAFPNVCRSGAVCEGVLHFTQMIWPTTIAVGCGNAVGRGSLWVVCRYNPGGNKDGKPVGIASRDDVPTIPSSAGAQISLNHDYGYDPALFVGYDLGGFRIESEVAYKKADQAASGHAGNAPLFDLGIYSGGAWTTDWFKLDSPGTPNDEYWPVSLGVILSLSEDTRLELGVGYEDYDHYVAPILDGIYWDPVSQVPMGSDPKESDQDTKVEQPQLPQGEVFKPDPPATLEDPL